MSAASTALDPIATRLPTALPWANLRSRRLALSDLMARTSFSPRDLQSPLLSHVFCWLLVCLLPATLIIRVRRRCRQLLEFRGHRISVHSNHQIMMKRPGIVLLERRAGSAGDQIERRLGRVGP